MLPVQAGGAASNGSHPLLQLDPATSETTSPAFLGSVRDVQRMETLLAQDTVTGQAKHNQTENTDKPKKNQTIGIDSTNNRTSYFPIPEATEDEEPLIEFTDDVFVSLDNPEDQITNIINRPKP